MYVFEDVEFKELKDYTNLQIKGYKLTFDTTTHSTNDKVRCRWIKDTGNFHVWITATNEGKFLVYHFDYSLSISGKMIVEIYEDLQEAVKWCNLFALGKYKPKQIL